MFLLLILDMELRHGAICFLIQIKTVNLCDLDLYRFPILFNFATSYGFVPRCSTE